MTPTLPAGYRPYPYEDPFEDHVGPFGYKVEDGRITFAVQTDERHRNTGGSVHGGMLMTFADFALCLTGDPRTCPASGASPCRCQLRVHGAAAHVGRPDRGVRPRWCAAPGR